MASTYFTTKILSNALWFLLISSRHQGQGQLILFHHFLILFHSYFILFLAFGECCHDFRKEYIKISFENPDGFDFLPGDHVAIFPTNAESDVDFICQRLGDINEEFTANTPVSISDENGNWIAAYDMPACSVKTALTYYLDISGPPHQNLLQKLIDRGCVKDRKEAEKLMEFVAVC